MIRVLVLSIPILLCLALTDHADGAVQPQTLRIGAFNIQVFGRTKAKKTDVMNILVHIIVRYDLILIQEIRDSKGTAIHQLLTQVNEHLRLSGSDQFEMYVSRRLGRTHSKEQYAYMYRPSSGLTIEKAFEYDDGPESPKTSRHNHTDQFEREPYLVKVRSQYTVPHLFYVIGIHVSPETAEMEIDHLVDVFNYIINTEQVPNVVAMGDMNADCSYVSKSEMKNLLLRNDARYTWFIDDAMDTTVKASDCSYDRFIFTGDSWNLNMISSSAKVYKFDQEMNVPYELACKVSDHYPIEFELGIRSSPVVGAVFSISEVVVILNPGNKVLKHEVYTLSLNNNRLTVETTEAEGSIPTEIGQLEEDDRQIGVVNLFKYLINTSQSVPPINVVYGRRKRLMEQKVTVHVQISSDHVIEVTDRFLEVCKRPFTCIGPGLN